MKLSEEAIQLLTDENERDIAKYMQTKKEKSVQHLFKGSTNDMRSWMIKELKKDENFLL